MENRRNVPLIVTSYLAIYLIWSSTYFFIAKAVETIPAPWIVFTRFTLAGSIMMIIPLVSGKIIYPPSRKEVFSSIFLGFFLLVMGNGVVTLAEKWVPSYFASLIISTVPLIVAILSGLVYKTKIKATQIIGFLIGFAGVAFLLYTETPRTIGEKKGILLLFLAITCWSFGTTWSRKLLHHRNILFSTGMQMLFAGFIALLIIIFQGESPRAILENSSTFSLLSVLFLAIVGGVAIIAYNYLLKNEPTERITSYALVNPLLATLLGIFIGKEAPTKYLIPGIILILLGLTVLLYLGRRTTK